MTQEQIDLLKSQLPISFNITMSMDFPNGITTNSAVYTKSDSTLGKVEIIPEKYPFARIAGMIGKSPQYGIILTWKYQDDPDNIIIDYCCYNNGNEVTIPILQLREFLLKLKG